MNFKKGLSVMLSCFIEFSAIGSIKAMDGNFNSQPNAISWWNPTYLSAVVSLLAGSFIVYTIHIVVNMYELG